MRRTQAGFTLIELVMVIVILGVLAAIAIPKFVDLKGDASTAAVQSVAGALNSAAAINYAARSAGNSAGGAMKTCASVVTYLQGGVLPTGNGNTYTVYDATDTTGGTTVVAANSVGSCTAKLVNTSGTYTATYNFTSIN